LTTDDLVSSIIFVLSPEVIFLFNLILTSTAKEYPSGLIIITFDTSTLNVII